LIFLGDICIGNDRDVHDFYVKDLPCKKILVRGNHDVKSYSWYIDHGWDLVVEQLKIKLFGKTILFSHIPEGLAHIGWDVCIHGHFHNMMHRPECFIRHNKSYLLYSPELENYKLCELSKFLKRLKV
jgi:calcineurin-like phosphoesterase family protein